MRRWWNWRDDDAYEMHWFAEDMGTLGASTPLNTRLLPMSPPIPKPHKCFCKAHVIGAVFGGALDRDQRVLTEDHAAAVQHNLRGCVSAVVVVVLRDDAVVVVQDDFGPMVKALRGSSIGCANGVWHWNVSANIPHALS